MAKTSGYVKAIDKLPIILQIILALPFLDSIVFGIYRLLKGKLLWGIIWIFLGALGVGSIIDIISILVNKKVEWFA